MNVKATNEQAATAQIFGYIERLTFHNHENGFTVAQLKQQGHADPTCVVGFMPGIQPGMSVRCQGHWKNHLVHGRQFDVVTFQVEAPADIVGIKKYLGSGLIKGIGPAYATRIVEIFGVDTLNIIDQFPEKLEKVPGLGKKRIEKIRECWSNQKSIRDVMVFLQTYGVSPAYAQKIFKSYGDKSIAKVKDNPYHLARDIFGIGFKTADTIAQKMGIAQDSDQRIDAGIEFVLMQLSNDGHVCYPVELFLPIAEKTLEIPQDRIQSRLPILQQNERIELCDILDEGKKKPFIWIRKLYISEVGITRELRRLKKGLCHLRSVDTDKAIDWAQQLLKIDLAPNQKRAVAQALTEKIQVITGGPGTGKSTITNAILSITSKLTGNIVLAAPTGRAAKRMSEITGKKASTIHSLLEFDFKNGGFKKNRESPLECDLIIIDEASMIDTQLMYSLVRALPDNARVIFVGDINQLPSVGPGNVLKDIIQSRTVPVTMLTEIFRQAQGSHIIMNAHRVNSGTFPNLSNGPDSDFFFVESDEGEDVLNNIVKLVTQRIPHRYGFNPLTDIQVLTPMKRGIIGTENINQVLQKSLNPKGQPFFRSGRQFQVGDKVMQIRNNYDKEVFNGDVGVIKELDEDEEQVLVTFDGRDVIYDFSEVDELVLAYAISVHKFQGSECPCVVIPIHTSHYMMLHRNLLYTAITRGKKLVVLVGMKKAIFIAVNNDDVQKRYTSLEKMLMDAI